MIGRALSLGARGYVLKTHARRELLNAVRTVLEAEKAWGMPITLRRCSLRLRTPSASATSLKLAPSGVLGDRLLDSSLLPERRARLLVVGQRTRLKPGHMAQNAL